MKPAWALLRLASPQLPIGGYSYSQGLEWAIDSGLITDAASAERWLADQLTLNLARFEAPLLLAHCRAADEGDWPRMQQLAEQHRASRETRELALESRQMGYSLRQLLEGLPELDEAAREALAAQDEPGLALAWALAAAAVPARAQGGVTLYGRLVAGIDYMNRVADAPGRSAGQWRQAGQWGATWWGLRGSEDLGGGLSAVFHLESQFALDEGRAGDSFFSRYAVVGLSGRSRSLISLGHR